MPTTVETATLHGIDAVPVEVQVDVSTGLPSFIVVGLADAAVLEARDRVRSAIRLSGFDFPNSRIVVNLAPAPLRKHGTGFDLPIAAAILVATRQLPAASVEGCVLVGELSLDGQVRPVPGLMVQARSAQVRGKTLIAPSAACAYEDSLPGLAVRPLEALRQLRSGDRHRPTRPNARPSAEPPPDFGDVVGQPVAKRALEIAASGGHNVLMTGPPGTGKSMLARALCGILPPLDPDERVTTALIHSVAGLDEAPVLNGLRPYRAPHHSATVAGLLGGGSPPRPGEASLAHNGVLFLDELPEFAPSTLQCLRQPLESGYVTLVRAEGRLTFPSRFTLVAAANPCPCGYLGDERRPCSCRESDVARYRGRVGGPLMDRMDIRVSVGRVDPARLLTPGDDEPSTAVAARVLEARQRAMYRSLRSGQRIAPPTVGGTRRFVDMARLTDDAARTLTASARACHLSSRGVVRVVSVARTIADIEGADRVNRDHVLEALGYRGWDTGASA